MPIPPLILAFAIVSVWKLYLFLMQRAALNVTRYNNLAPDLRMRMLPRIYRLTGWPTVVAQWVLLYFIWDSHGLGDAILAFVAYGAATMLMPVPFGHFFPMFRRVLLARPGSESEELLGALESTRTAAMGPR